jgi:hypothetical protein
MARIIGGSPYGFLSGKIGGLVASHNKGGQYLRQYVIPTNPNTGRQAAVRANFGNAGSLYHTLTGSEKQAWATWASNGFRPLHGADPGVTYSGQQAFMSSQFVKAMLDEMAFKNGDATPIRVPLGTTVTNTFPDLADFTAPSGILSAAIKDNSGNTLPLEVEDLEVYTDGSMILDIKFGSHGGLTQASAPLFVDANTSEPIGFYVLASKFSTEQVPMYRGEPARLIAAFPNFEITAGWTASSSMRLGWDAPTAVDYLEQIKTWYDLGDTVQYDVYAVSVIKGNTAIIGSFTGQVYAP